MKSQLYDMLTKNQKSKYNNQSNLKSLKLVEISRQRKEKTILGGPESVTCTVYLEDEAGENVVGAYFI